jgi:glucose-6-phosphate dehydrogenase assembly protein OpcA
MIRGALAAVVLAVLWPAVRLFAWWDDHTNPI